MEMTYETNQKETLLDKIEEAEREIRILNALIFKGQPHYGFTHEDKKDISVSEHMTQFIHQLFSKKEH